MFTCSTNLRKSVIKGLKFVGWGQDEEASDGGTQPKYRVEDDGKEGAV